MRTRWLNLLVLLPLMLLLVGCGEHLAGTHDAKIELTVKAPAKTPLTEIHQPKPTFGKAPTPAEAAVLPVTVRLATMHITADVEPLGNDKLVLTLDEDEVASAKDLLTWRGGVELDELDPSFPITLGDSKGLTEKTDTVDGVTDHYWEGPREAVAAAIAKTTVPEGHALLAQAYDVKRGRTRLVKKPGLADLSDAVEKIDRLRSGKSLSLVIHADAQSRIDEAVTKADGKPIAIVRAGSVLAVKVVTKGTRTFELDFGDDIYSYTRAHSVQKALLTPPTPQFEFGTPSPLSPDYAVAIASIVLPIFLSMMWLVFVRRFDRAHPEPWWLVLTTFALGGLSVIPAGFAEYVLQTASPYLSPEVMTFGGQIMGFIPALVVFTVVVGLSEEGSKFLGAWSLARHRREFDEPIDGMVYGAASALGFAAVENVKYFAVGRLGGTLIVARLFMSVPGHMFFGALWGYAMGQKLVRKKTPVWAYLLLAALLHGAFDTMLSIEGTALGAMLENLILAGLFVILLRRSLRHGAVEKAGEDAPLSAQRWYYTVGSPGFFVLHVIGFHVAAVVCFGVGIYFEVAHHRIGIVFIYVCAALVSLVGFIGYGLSQTMPLDVAVDAVGVTFAGSVRRWGRITAIERFTTWGVVGPRHNVRVRSEDGDLVIGPTSAVRVDELGSRLTAAKAAAPAPQPAQPAGTSPLMATVSSVMRRCALVLVAITACAGAPTQGPAAPGAGNAAETCGPWPVDATDDALVRIAAACEASGAPGRAIEARRIVVARPATSTTADSLYHLGTDLRAIGEYDQAATTLERFAIENPTATDAMTALSDATILRMGLGDDRHVREDAERFKRTYGANTEMTAKIAFALGANAKDHGDWPMVERELTTSMTLIDRGPVYLRMAAHALLAKALLRDPRSARVAAASAEYARVRELAKGLRPASNEPIDLKNYARGLLALGDAVVFAADERRSSTTWAHFAPYVGSGDEKDVDAWVTTVVAPWIAARRVTIEALEPEYQKVLTSGEYPAPSAVIDASARVATMWIDATSELHGAPHPKKWDNTAGTPLRKRYQEKIDAAGKGLVAQAKSTAQACVAYSVKFQYVDDAATACAAWLTKTFPAEVPRLDELLIAPSFRASTVVTPPAPLEAP